MPFCIKHEQAYKQSQWCVYCGKPQAETEIRIGPFKYEGPFEVAEPGDPCPMCTGDRYLPGGTTCGEKYHYGTHDSGVNPPDERYTGDVSGYDVSPCPHCSFSHPSGETCRFPGYTTELEGWDDACEMCGAPVCTCYC